MQADERLAIFPGPAQRLGAEKRSVEGSPFGAGCAAVFENSTACTPTAGLPDVECRLGSTAKDLRIRWQPEIEYAVS